MADDDLILLDRWIEGDAAAGNALFKRHFATVYRFFELKTDGDIDDLVQDTFMACMNSRASFRRQSSFRTYLFAIARHTLCGYWRRRAGNRTTPLDFDEISFASLSTSAGTRLARHENHALLLSALRSLPLEQQILLEMYYWEDLDRDQLAEVFDVETSTIGTRLFRARAALYETLDASGGGRPIEAVGDLDAWARALSPASQPAEPRDP